ncbi:unnamed protein product [Schistosoma curassoni]|uniref:Uncharacterized protein n=1 Tax=Schistosoma curassoni TaxID=6186 RepID=A0A183KUP0_9TREM|nr:unnamed protein product [Schistosoma curassoni]
MISSLCRKIVRFLYFLLKKNLPIGVNLNCLPFLCLELICLL